VSALSCTPEWVNYFKDWRNDRGAPGKGGGATAQPWGSTVPPDRWNYSLGKRTMCLKVEVIPEGTTQPEMYISQKDLSLHFTSYGKMTWNGGDR
jgi:hypothetical protein